MIEEANKIVDDYFRAKENGDFDLMKECFWQNENLFYIGSDKGEIWNGWDMISNYLKAQIISFESFKAKRKKLFEKELEKDKIFLFVEENEVTISLKGKSKTDSFIISILVEKIEGNFKITFLHRSLPSKEPSFPYSFGTVRFA